MKPRIDNHLVAAFACCIVLPLTGCERVLAVVDELEPPGSGTPGSGSGGGSSTPPAGSSCACAASASLMPLSCDPNVEVPLLDNDIVHTTADGSIVAFTVCEGEFGNCRVVYWDGQGPARSIADGFVIGMSASGHRVLSGGNGTFPGLPLTDLNGAATTVPLSEISGKGALSADGNMVVGASYSDTSVQLVRSDVRTAVVETLGELFEFPARGYVTPDASAIVGWGFDRVDDLSYWAFRWSADDGLTFGLPGVPADNTPWPEAVSDDGSAIAGRSPVNQSHFYWTEAGGYVDLAPASWRSETFLSADGSAVLGALIPDDVALDSAAFRWTAETGVVDLTPGTPSLATAISRDGNVVLAYSWDDAQLEGGMPEDTFIWDAENGTRTLDSILSERGVDVTGWEFGHPRKLSGDGNVVLGRARCGGVATLYRVALTP